MTVKQSDTRMYTTIDTALEQSAMQMQSMTATELILRADQLVQWYNNPLLVIIPKILIAQKAGAISLYDLKVGNARSYQCMHISVNKFKIIGKIARKSNALY